MSHVWVVVVIYVVIAGILYAFVIWVCLSAFHEFIREFNALSASRGYVVLSAFTVGERHMCPLTPAVHGLPVPAAVAREARGKGEAPPVVFGKTPSIPIEAILEARNNFMDIIYFPSTMGSVLHALFVSTFLCNRASRCMRPSTRTNRSLPRRPGTGEAAVPARTSLWSRARDGVAASEVDGKLPAV